MSDPLRDLVLLRDMLDVAKRAVAETQGWSRADLVPFSFKALGLERAVEIIGEAARSISPTFRDAHPQIPWSKIIKTRHVIAHEYRRVNYDVLWTIATVHLPVLVEGLESILPPPPPDPEPESDS